ncbi:MAG: nucleotide sugar dehydrogenase [Nitrospinota bacterium]|nr:nucleotide sugar dehydrogenase [Nitrospinota bacterium]
MRRLDTVVGPSMNLLQAIENRKIRSAVIGAGYVGLPLAVEFALAGYDVTVIDIDADKVRRINKGESYIPDVSEASLRRAVREKRLRATVDYSEIRRMDSVNICVPTPLRKTKDPDLSYVVTATENVRDHLHRGLLVILESTTYPGTTEEIVLPILEETGLRVGQDFHLAFSPERVDPGNPQYSTRSIPKVVGGITPACCKLAVALYRNCIDKVVPVSSTRVAELVKLLENTFRSVNIGMVNEMALLCNQLKIDVWEVIDAASTKPFGFMPFYPGPGLGGHCIPVDPFYLSWKAKMNGFEARFIELAGTVNSMMPGFVVEKVTEALNRRSKSVRGSRVHALGVTYKRDTDDIRESPALDVLTLLAERGARLSYTDPYVSEIQVLDKRLKGVEGRPAVLRAADCVVLLTDHKAFALKDILKDAKIIVDTRNAFKKFKNRKIFKL